ncbi:MAG: hypothetical protein QF649_03195, partial [SAR324 cluster bacterium]|nr:hypothetical protein [SAR324 cluster bacterium]
MTISSSRSGLSHLEKQLELLTAFNLQVPCNPQGDFAKAGFKKLLQSLKTTKISDSIRASYNAEHLKKWKEYAQREFNEMGRINRLRLESLMLLSDEEMIKTMFEGLLIFDINPEDSRQLEVHEKTGKYNDDGKPVTRNIAFDVFKKDAIHGIEGIERFLPSPAIKGETGMDAHLEHEFSGTDLVSHFKKDSAKMIKALTTIGSLGGIGHKPDSDMDAQVIINTNPEFQFSWNDADFLVALIANVLESFYDQYFRYSLTAKERIEINKTAIATLKEKCSEGISEEELRVIDSIFASSYRRELRKLIQAHVQKRPAEEQRRFFLKAVITTLNSFPDCEDLLSPLNNFFPFIKNTGGDLERKGFPFSFKQFKKEK